jgi:hypothetical protein
MGSIENYLFGIEFPDIKISAGPGQCLPAILVAENQGRLQIGGSAPLRIILN